MKGILHFFYFFPKNIDILSFIVYNDFINKNQLVEAQGESVTVFTRTGIQKTMKGRLAEAGIFSRRAMLVCRKTFCILSFFKP